MNRRMDVVSMRLFRRNSVLRHGTALVHFLPLVFLRLCCGPYFCSFRELAAKLAGARIAHAFDSERNLYRFSHGTRVLPMHDRHSK